MKNKTAKKLKRITETLTIGLGEHVTKRFYRQSKANYKAVKKGLSKPYTVFK